MAYAFNGLTIINIDIKMPILLPNKRTMGRWTLRNTLSASSHRKVFFALN